MAVVNLGNPDRAPQRAAIIVFSIENLPCEVRAAHQIVEPRLRVQCLVSEKVVHGPVASVRTGLGGEALNPSRGAPKLSGDG